MNAPEMLPTREAAPGIAGLNAWMPVPGFGCLPVNSWLLKARRPLLVDTGLSGLRTEFLREISRTIQLTEIAWIWITHADADHIGNLAAILDLAPQARIATTYLGMGKLAMQEIPPERCHLVNPGQPLDLGDREVYAVAPPIFDAPETTGLFDPSTATLFSSDCFGALLPESATTANEIDSAVLREGMMGWASADAPWIHQLEPDFLTQRLARIRALRPKHVLSSHLPPARGMIDVLLENLENAPKSTPFRAPDGEQLQALLAATG